jgi:hypothetical protein
LRSPPESICTFFSDQLREIEPGTYALALFLSPHPDKIAPPEMIQNCFSADLYGMSLVTSQPHGSPHKFPASGISKPIIKRKSVVSRAVWSYNPNNSCQEKTKFRFSKKSLSPYAFATCRLQ